MLLLMLWIFSRLISTSTTPGFSPPQSPSTSPQGSTARAWPYDWRFPWCCPTCAAARTKHWFSIARARSNTWEYIQEVLVCLRIYCLSQKWVHPSHFCKYVIFFHRTTLKKWHFDTSYFERTVNLHCYKSFTLATLHCIKVSFLQCCPMKRYNKIFAITWGVYSLLWDTVSQPSLWLHHDSTHLPVSSSCCYSEGWRVRQNLSPVPLHSQRQLRESQIIADAEANLWQE